MNRITLPKTIEAAKASLTALDGLVTATEWERAAIVYAFTQDGDGRPGPKTRDRLLMVDLTPGDFAKLGISGLRSKDTVRKYRATWQSAIDRGTAKPVKPGQTISLPTENWPGKDDDGYQGDPTTYTRDNPDSFAKAIGRGKVEPEELVAALDEDTAEDLMRAVIARKVETSPRLLAPREDPYVRPIGIELAACSAAASNNMRRMVALLTELRRDGKELTDEGATDLLRTMGFWEARISWIRGFVAGDDVADEAAQFLQNL